MSDRKQAIESSPMNCIGVDQTGAVDHHGKPKPLHAAIITNEGQGLRLSPLRLRQLSHREISPEFNGESLESYIWVIDCVLGLPPGFPPLRKVMQRAAQKSCYGREAAREFFAELLLASKWESIPSRKVEILLGANSVFRNVPFQRNIQTGTFRIWKELGSDPQWFDLGGHEKRHRNRSWIIEGYPSLAWRKLFSVKTRSTDEFPKLLKSKFPFIKVSTSDLKEFRKSADACDAAVLAIQAATQEQTLAKFSSPMKPEGWILGA